MKVTFETELAALATSCGIQLARKEEQLDSWTREFSGDPDEIIRAAFVNLRAAGGFAKDWPTYQEIKTAFSRARNAAEATGRVARRKAEDAAANSVGGGRLMACYIYARMHRDLKPQAEIEKFLKDLLSDKWSDVEIDEYVRANRNAVKGLSDPAGHTERELKLATAAWTNGAEGGA